MNQRGTPLNHSAGLSSFYKLNRLQSLLPSPTSVAEYLTSLTKNFFSWNCGRFEFMPTYAEVSVLGMAMRIYLPMRIDVDIRIIWHMSDIARYMPHIFRIGILSASAWPSLICIWRLNSPHTCTSLALFPFVSLSPVYDPDEKFWNYFKLAGTLTLTITFPAANAALWMPIKGTTDPWVDAITRGTL